MVVTIDSRRHRRPGPRLKICLLAALITCRLDAFKDDSLQRYRPHVVPHSTLKDLPRSYRPKNVSPGAAGREESATFAQQQVRRIRHPGRKSRQ